MGLRRADRRWTAQLGATVISALTFVQEKPEFSGIATQLAMVAMNLKNLR